MYFGQYLTRRRTSKSWPWLVCSMVMLSTLDMILDPSRVQAVVGPGEKRAASGIGDLAFISEVSLSSSDGRYVILNGLGRRGGRVIVVGIVDKVGSGSESLRTTCDLLRHRLGPGTCGRDGWATWTAWDAATRARFLSWYLRCVFVRAAFLCASFIYIFRPIGE